MDRFLWVCLGGAAGAGARFLATSWLAPRLGDSTWWATFAVNVTGSFVVAALLESGLRGGWLSPRLSAVLVIGVLGGFTTYSAFNQEMVSLLARRSYGACALYGAATLATCLAAGGLGILASRLVRP